MTEFHYKAAGYRNGIYGTRRRNYGNCQYAGSDTLSMFSRILTFSGWPGWLNTDGYKHAMLYLDANIKDACYSSKATLP